MKIYTFITHQRFFLCFFPFQCSSLFIEHVLQYMYVAVIIVSSSSSSLSSVFIRRVSRIIMSKQSDTTNQNKHGNDILCMNAELKRRQIPLHSSNMLNNHRDQSNVPMHQIFLSHFFFYMSLQCFSSSGSCHFLPFCEFIAAISYSFYVEASLEFG